MSQLTQLIEKVKEENLSKDILEKYHTDITYLDNILRMEIAPIEKAEAIFFEKFREQTGIKDATDISIKRAWKASEQGQRQIELSHYLKITPKLLQSIKTRLYSIY